MVSGDAAHAGEGREAHDDRAGSDRGGPSDHAGHADPATPTACLPQPLREYALLADGERGALVGPRGEYAWMCAPRWDSDAVFSTLVGGTGTYAVTPTGRFVWGGSYEEGSLIWRSHWVTDDGVVDCREALAFPGDPHRAVILRSIEARDAPARVRVVLEPRAGFGRRPLTGLAKDEAGVWTGTAGDLRMRWSGGEEARPAGRAGHRLETVLTLHPGERRDLVLELSDRPLPAGPPDPAREWRATEAAWAETVPPLRGSIAAGDALRSYAVLRGLTGTGDGMVAAATTSLPERAEEGRNYDYRYVWIRDQCFAGQAAAAAGAPELLDAAVRFVSARLLDDGPALAPAYTAEGGRIPDQRPLDLPGYPGGFDLVGNHVTKQFQLDSFGEALLLFSAAARHGRLDGEGWQAARTAAGAIAHRWREPDAGIWELDDRPWAHSRLICAAGLRRMAAAGAPPARSAEWTALADRLVADTAAHSLHPVGRWQRAPGDPRLDGALLLPAVRGGMPVEDPRTRATLDAYLAHLTDDFFAYRFRHDERPLAEAEGAFLLCGFVVALAEQQQGREISAYRWFERNRAAAGGPGLYAEEYDIEQRQLRGNLPQAFVHALMLEASLRLGDPAREGGAPR
ncbi:glycoside hydrolase family 15 protein [Streptomyces sp. ODS28]|uniref:glycoside hydrolase family 15 protein n=1 Tax=Streptomyces sp. ODS28 TaxID=3136688 RepID=UPI0031ED9EB3